MEKTDAEQLEKRVTWLDNERRNDKTIIAALQSKLENMETENMALRTRQKEMESEITRLNTLMVKLEQFELDISSIRTETGRQIEGFTGAIQEKQIQSDKNFQKIEDLNADVIELQKKVLNVGKIGKSLEERQQEDLRLARSIEELKTQVNEVDHFNEDYKRSLKLIDENLRQDAKRLSDVTGEVAALRKRQDETRGRQDLAADQARKLEKRIKELQESESERREAQTAFMEKVTIAQVDRDRTLKDWSDRFEKMEKITISVEEELKGLEETHRSVKLSQAGLEEVTQRFERRVNEITEIQRLNEDRFRQEWTTFKSDDQKRWANYSLAQDEQHREMNRELESVANRISQLEELIEGLQDNFQQIGNDNITRLQTLLTTYRESIETYNNIFKK